MAVAKAWDISLSSAFWSSTSATSAAVAQLAKGVELSVNVIALIAFSASVCSSSGIALPHTTSDYVFLSVLSVPENT